MAVQWKFARSARRHGISRGRAEQAMGNAHLNLTVHSTLDPKIVWIGVDKRGLELEVVAVVLPGRLLVIHVMPTSFRRRQRWSGV